MISREMGWRTYGGTEQDDSQEKDDLPGDNGSIHSCAPMSLAIVFRYTSSVVTFTCNAILNFHTLNPEQVTDVNVLVFLV